MVAESVNEVLDLSQYRAFLVFHPETPNDTQIWVTDGSWMIPVTDEDWLWSLSYSSWDSQVAAWSLCAAASPERWNDTGHPCDA